MKSSKKFHILYLYAQNAGYRLKVNELGRPMKLKQFALIVASKITNFHPLFERIERCEPNP